LWSLVLVLVLVLVAVFVVIRSLPSRVYKKEYKIAPLPCWCKVGGGWLKRAAVGVNGWLVGRKNGCRVVVVSLVGVNGQLSV
jgi:hypothetical protein